MKILDIINSTEKPKLYTKGNSVMWTDKYISKQLLNIHLNREVDLASRKQETIEKTINWILKYAGKKKLNILDLGCGPGLYTQILSEKGHNVTGVDFSEYSIQYARKEAKRKKLNIGYINKDYLKLDLKENTFDLIILIYTDLGVLLPDERDELLCKVHKMLKPGGVFIFDVLNDKNIEKKIIPASWEASRHGFWKDKPYLVLSNSFFYEKEKVTLAQHTVVDGKDNINIYRFWMHYFSHKDLKEMLTKRKFYKLTFSEDVLPKGDIWNGKNVTFCKAVKR